jgi:hypothetical protein
MPACVMQEYTAQLHKGPNELCHKHGSSGSTMELATCFAVPEHTYDNTAHLHEAHLFDSLQKAAVGRKCQESRRQHEIKVISLPACNPQGQEQQNEGLPT